VVLFQLGSMADKEFCGGVAQVVVPAGLRQLETVRKNTVRPVRGSRLQSLVKVLNTVEQVSQAGQQIYLHQIQTRVRAEVLATAQQPVTVQVTPARLEL
jgi:hypothetical protein